MAGITWTNVRGSIPQPMVAEDAIQGARQVEARLWFAPDVKPTYRVQFRLTEIGSPIETWEHDYNSGANGQSWAFRRYGEYKESAIRWLEGWPLDDVRPSGRRK